MIFWVKCTYNGFNAYIYFPIEKVRQNITTFSFQFLFEHSFERKNFIFNLDLGTKLMTLPTI